MNEKDIDRIVDKILEKIRNDKDIKAEKQLTPFQKTAIRTVIIKRSY